MARRLWIGVAAMVVAGAGPAAAADPVVVADERLTVQTADGTGVLALFLSADWTKPQPEAKRAVVIFHGDHRNAQSYFKTANRAREKAGELTAMLIAPHFITARDLQGKDIDDADQLLRWTSDSWKGGLPAQAPAPVSSYDAIDTILARLADRSIFPNLAKVVLAGHSAGGQILQRYAILSKGAAKLTDLGIAVRYVVANPSSYAYFSPDRPYSTARCKKTYDLWKYGMQNPPPYAGSSIDVKALERAYAARDILYLLGTKDTATTGEGIDTKCQAKAQGPNRYKRGESFFDYLRGRNPDHKHRFVPIEGVGHSAGRMFRSFCGIAVVFDRPGCEG